MRYLPIFIDLRAQRCLLVGGGVVALRKAELLLLAGASLTIVAKEICAQLASLAAERGASVFEREYASSDLAGVKLVVAATDENSVNTRVAADASARNVLVNVVDSPALCSFIVPAIVDRSPVLVAISTAGASPLLARMTRGRIEAALPEELGRLAEFAASHRETVKRELKDPGARRAFWERLFEGELGEHLRQGREHDAEAVFANALLGRHAQATPHLAVIGCGDGDVERLSFGAVRRLSSADLIVYEAPVGANLLALMRRDAAREELGTFDPVRANELFQRVHSGQRVCVVCHGDLDGDRAAAVLEHLRGRGLPVAVFPPAPPLAMK